METFENLDEPSVEREPSVEIPEETLPNAETKPETIDIIRAQNSIEQKPEIDTKENAPEKPIAGQTTGQTTASDSAKPSDDIQSNIDPQIDQAVQSLSQIDGLDPNTWQTLDANERIAVLNDIESQMASIQHRSPVDITLDETLSSTTFGGWDGQQIRINAAHLDSEMPVDEFIDTIVHEGRHAYQDYSVQHDGFEHNQDLVNGWEENNEYYLDPTLYGQELYQSQPVEADAWDYASRIRNALIAANWR